VTAVQLYLSAESQTCDQDVTQLTGSETLALLSSCLAATARAVGSHSVDWQQICIGSYSVD